MKLAESKNPVCFDDLVSLDAQVDAQEALVGDLDASRRPMFILFQLRKLPSRGDAPSKRKKDKK
jgi:hypothetical protein